MSLHDLSSTRDKCHSACEFEMIPQQQHQQQQPATLTLDSEDGGKLERTPSHSLPAVSVSSRSAPQPPCRHGNGAGSRGSPDVERRSSYRGAVDVASGGVRGGKNGSGGGRAAGRWASGGSGGSGAAAGGVRGGGGGPCMTMGDSGAGFVDVDDVTMQVDRDPNHWHDTVKVKFDDIFGEPDPEVFSIDPVWTTSNKVYTLSKFWCYRIMSILLAVPLAACCGVYFACLVFCRVWFCIPCLRMCDIKLQCVRRLNEIAVRSLVAPLYEAVGRLFYHMRIKVIRSTEDGGIINATAA